MSSRTLQPQYSPWLRDFLFQGVPSTYRGMPGEYDFSAEDYISSWEGQLCPANYIHSNGQCVYVGDPQSGEDFAAFVDPEEGFLRPPAGIMSDYPGYKEQYSIRDYLIGRERVSGEAETKRTKMGDLLEGIQSIVSGDLDIGSAKRESENQRKAIYRGLANVDAKRDFGLKAQEIELAESVYDLRMGHEEQASEDYLSWLSNYIEPEEEVVIDEDEDDTIQPCLADCSMDLLMCQQDAETNESYSDCSTDYVTCNAYCYQG